MPSETCTKSGHSCAWRAAKVVGGEVSLCLGITEGGNPCGAKAVKSFGPHSFCIKHGKEVALAVIESMQGEQVMATVAKSYRKRQSQERQARAPKQGRVYFVRRGNRVKIGYTTDPDTRLATLTNMGGEEFDEVVIIRGTPKDERRYHAEFDDFRKVGEWFEMAAPIRAEMNRIRRSQSRRKAS